MEILRLQIGFLKFPMTFHGHTGLIGPTETFFKKYICLEYSQVKNGVQNYR